jgi:hypothetical protein
MMKKKPTVKAKGVYRGKETAAEERQEAMMPMGYKNGGLVTGCAPNEPTGTQGPGVRSQQDYKK